MFVRRQILIILLFIIIILLIVVGSNIYKMQLITKLGTADTYKRSNKGKVIIHIEVDNKVLYLIDNNSKEIIKKYTVATGKSGSPTPLGTFKIIEKGKWGEGFGSRWIGLDVPWGKYGVHGTNKPGSIGSNVSAGCVRMRNTDVEEVYEQVNIGSIVIITNGLYGPFGYGFRNIKPGDRGSDVFEVQKRLLKFGFYEGPLDGIYGEVMKKGWISFLKARDIELTDKLNPEILEQLGIILMD